MYSVEESLDLVDLCMFLYIEWLFTVKRRTIFSCSSCDLVRIIHLLSIKGNPLAQFGSKNGEKLLFSRFSPQFSKLRNLWTQRCYPSDHFVWSFCYRKVCKFEFPVWVYWGKICIKFDFKIEKMVIFMKFTQCLGFSH